MTNRLISFLGYSESTSPERATAEPTHIAPDTAGQVDPIDRLVSFLGFSHSPSGSVDEITELIGPTSRLESEEKEISACSGGDFSGDFSELEEKDREVLPRKEVVEKETCSASVTHSSKRPRRCDAEIWADRVKDSTIGAAVGSGCCGSSCVQQNCTVAAIRSCRLQNANRLPYC